MKLNWNVISKYRAELYGISILWVMLFHVQEALSKTSPWTKSLKFILDNGNIGVDIFLFISGISLYYWFKRNPNASTLDFYKKRFTRFIYIYLLISVPFFLYWFLIFRPNTDTLIKQLTFTAYDLNSFWYLGCTSICYLIYPIFYKKLEQGNRYFGWVVLIGLVTVLTIYSIVSPARYLYHNIALSRFPIFIVGTIVGPLVYEKKEIPIWFFLIMIVLTFVLPDFITIILKKTHMVGTALATHIYRLRQGVQGIGCIFLLIPFVQTISEYNVGAKLRYIGNITLELYVTHIVIRRLMVGPFNYNPRTAIGYFVFTIIMVITSYIVSIYLNKLLTKLTSKLTVKAG